MLSRRQLFQWAAVSASAPFLTACSSPLTGTETIRVGVTSRPRMLDPRKATDALSSRVNRLIYRQLIDFNQAFEPVPELARWQALSPTHYRFTLTDFPQFHNGESLAAEDVAATYRSVLNEGFGSPHRGSLKHIQSIEVLSESEVDFKLTRPDALFVGRLVIGILPKSLIEADHPFQLSPVGSGPCRFVSMTEQKLVLQRPDATQLVFMPVKDATVRVLKLRKGELDIIQNDLSPELVHYCDQRKDLNVLWHSGTSFGYVGFNFEDPLLSQLEVRQALAYGIDRQAVIDSVFSGHARLAGGLLVPEHWCGVPGLHGFDYRPDKARALVDAVKQKHPGLVNSDGMLEFSYKTSSDPTRIRLATIYQSQLREVGIHLKVQSYDWGTFYSDIKQGRFQLYSLAWVGVKSPDIFQYVFDSDAIPPKGANRGRYRNAEADRLIREAGETQSLAKQAKLYRELQVHLQETLAVIPLWYEDQYAVTRSTISGYRMYADGRFDGLLDVTKTTSG